MVEGSAVPVLVSSVQPANVHIVDAVNRNSRQKQNNSPSHQPIWACRFHGHEEARENLSVSCHVNCDNYLELLSLRAKDLPQVKLKIVFPVSSFGHGKGLGSVLTFKTK